MSKIIKYDVSIYSDSSLSTFVQHYGLEDQEGIENPIDVQLSNLSIGKKYWAKATVKDDTPSDSSLSNTFPFSTLTGPHTSILSADYEQIQATVGAYKDNVQVSEVGLHISDTSTFDGFDRVSLPSNRAVIVPIKEWGTKYIRAYAIDEYKRETIDSSVHSAFVPKGVREPDPKKYFRIRNISSDDGAISIDTSTYSAGNVSDLQYSYDADHWVDVEAGIQTDIRILSGQEVLFRNDNYADEESVRYHFVVDQMCEFDGDIRSIINYHTIEDIDTIGAFMFYHTFWMGGPFVNTPDFNWVRSIEESGLSGTFDGCTDIATASGFSSLENVSKNAFYYTYSVCTSLKAGPQFPHKIELAASPDETYFEGMFYGAQNISYVYAPNITMEWNDNVFAEWLYDINSEGIVDFYNEAQLTTVSEGENGRPEGWVSYLNGKEY